MLVVVQTLRGPAIKEFISWWGRYICRHLITIQHNKCSDRAHVMLGEGSEEVLRDQREPWEKRFLKGGWEFVKGRKSKGIMKGKYYIKVSGGRESMVQLSN